MLRGESEDNVQGESVSGDGKTLKDVAEKLGVSIATVSRALAGQERISTETRLKVAKAAEDMPAE